MLERDEELLSADGALRAAEHGAGSVVVLEGPAGIGKTSLLAAIARRAQHRGLICLSATAGERERELEWAVVRSLLGGAVAVAACRTSLGPSFRARAGASWRCRSWTDRGVAGSALGSGSVAVRRCTGSCWSSLPRRRCS